MSRLHAFFLAVLVACLMTAAVPLSYAMWQALLPFIRDLGIWGYSALMSSVAAPFFYAMFRRMH